RPPACRRGRARRAGRGTGSCRSRSRWARRTWRGTARRTGRRTRSRSARSCSVAGAVAAPARPCRRTPAGSQWSWVFLGTAVIGRADPPGPRPGAAAPGRGAGGRRSLVDRDALLRELGGRGLARRGERGGDGRARVLRVRLLHVRGERADERRDAGAPGPVGVDLAGRRLEHLGDDLAAEEVVTGGEELGLQARDGRRVDARSLDLRVDRGGVSAQPVRDLPRGLGVVAALEDGRERAARVAREVVALLPLRKLGDGPVARGRGGGVLEDAREPRGAHDRRDRAVAEAGGPVVAPDVRADQVGVDEALPVRGDLEVLRGVRRDGPRAVLDGVPGGAGLPRETRVGVVPVRAGQVY